MIQAERVAKILCALGARMKMGLGWRIAYANDRPHNWQPAMMRKLPGDHFRLVISTDDLPNRMERNRNQTIALRKGLLNLRQFP